jgi:glycosyltransferase involved in cell wall biosynthesis
MNNATGGEKPHAAQPLISATIICKNEVEKIRGALNSVRFCDEVIVVDSGSTDGTLEICYELADRVVENEWPGYIAQQNYATSLANGKWVLSIDADERVTPELAKEIVELLRSGADMDGYAITRHVYYLGRWIDHSGWYPELRVRLFQKGKGNWEGTEPHYDIVAQGPVGKLKGEIQHYTYDDLQDQVARTNNFTDLLAREHDRRGRKATLGHLVFRPPLEFFKKFVFKSGYKDGLPGFILAVTSAFYVFLKFAKLWERQNVGDKKPWLDDGE